jgi:hypothetical protein
MLFLMGELLPAASASAILPAKPVPEPFLCAFPISRHAGYPAPIPFMLMIQIPNYFYYCGPSVIQHRTLSLVISPSGSLP